MQAAFTLHAFRKHIARTSPQSHKRAMRGAQGKTVSHSGQNSRSGDDTHVVSRSRTGMRRTSRT
eukprot:1510497-Pleurochrysis_carterae.AAC.1